MPKGGYIRLNQKHRIMAAFPLSVLALAAGVYLLVKVKREYLGSLFSVLAWLVIVASLVSVGVTGAKAIHGFKRGGCKGKEHRIEKKIIINEEAGGHRKGHCNMEGCRMEGDSCVMEKATCEKLMGKDACDAMEKERGRCIMSKEECMEMCHSPKAKTGCSAHAEGEAAGEEKPACCRKK